MIQAKITFTSDLITIDGVNSNDVSNHCILTLQHWFKGTDGIGIPMGGTTGQYLVKKSNDDYDTYWRNGGGGGGENGSTFIPNVSQEGVISWTNDGELPNPEPVNIKGGDGKNGEDGLTPYIKNNTWWIGSTNTGIVAKGENGKDGKNGIDGENGKNATINGVNTLSLTKGDNITLVQEGSNLTISSTTEQSVLDDIADIKLSLDGVKAFQATNLFIIGLGDGNNN